MSASSETAAKVARVLAPQPGPQTDFLTSPATVVVYGGSAGGGKMQRVDEPVPTPFGWTTMGELRAGDIIFNEKGQPIKVTAVHPIVTPPECWRLTFDDGSKVESCSEHLWLTYDADDLGRMTKTSPEWKARRRAKRPSRATGLRSETFNAAITERNRKRGEAHQSEPVLGAVRTTRQIADTLRTPKGRANHAMPVALPLDLPPVDLPLDPYLLGLWLGDGSTNSGQITTADQEVVDAFTSRGHTLGATQSQEGNASSTYRIVGLTKLLRSLGLLGAKHVPTAYLRASKDQRLEVLRGLMDSDGHASKAGTLEYSTTSPALRDGFCELVVSLGMKVGCREGIAKLEGRAIGPKWRIKFSAPFVVFHLPRKAARQRLATRRTTTLRYVVDAERVASTPMRCITVENPAGLYLVGRSMLVTHNTFSLLLEAARHAQVPGWTGVIFRRTFPQLTNPGQLVEKSREVFPALGGVYRDLPNLDVRFPGREPGTLGGALAFRSMQNEKDREKWMGAELAFVGFDEATHFSERQVTYLMSRMRSTCGVEPIIRMTCNPDPNSFLCTWLMDAGYVDRDTGYAIPERSGVVMWYTRNEAGKALFFNTREEALQHGAFGSEPLTFTFIRSTLDDNQILLQKNPQYRSMLSTLPRADRLALQLGCWLHTEPGDYFDRSWFRILPLVLLEHRVVRWVRAWDLAATEEKPGTDPDWTVGALVGITDDNDIVIADIIRKRLSPGRVEELIRNTALQDGLAVEIAIPQDPGQAGKSQVAHFKRDVLPVGAVVSAKTIRQNKETYAKVWSGLAEPREGASFGRVFVAEESVRWRSAFFSEIEAFPPEQGHDDQVDAVSLGVITLLEKRSGGSVKPVHIHNL